MATNSNILNGIIPWTEEPTVHVVAKEWDMLQQLNNNNNETEPMNQKSANIFYKGSDSKFLGFADDTAFAEAT